LKGQDYRQEEGGKTKDLTTVLKEDRTRAKTKTSRIFETCFSGRTQKEIPHSKFGGKIQS
jgi:hypothetical protein